MLQIKLNTWWERLKKREPDSSEGNPANKPDMMHTVWITRNAI